MDTRQLTCFLRIVETRSISRAAISLGISQPSLSQQLLRLEDELGVKLFKRVARGVTVTEAGRLFEEHARYLLTCSVNAVESLRELTGSAGGQVIFTVPPTLIRLIGVPLFEAFKGRAPGASLRLGEALTANIFSWLEEGKIDLGILYDLGPRPNLSMRRLVSEELFLVGAPGTFADDNSVAPESLNRYDLIVPGLPFALRQLLDREAARFGVALRIAHEMDSFEQIVALVVRGHGHTILPRAAIAEDITAGRLDVRGIADGSLQRTLCLARNPARTLTHASVVAENLTVRVILELIDSGLWNVVPSAGLR